MKKIVLSLFLLASLNSSVSILPMDDRSSQATSSSGQNATAGNQQQFDGTGRAVFAPLIAIRDTQHQGNRPRFTFNINTAFHRSVLQQARGRRTLATLTGKYDLTNLMQSQTYFACAIADTMAQGKITVNQFPEQQLQNYQNIINTALCEHYDEPGQTEIKTRLATLQLAVQTEIARRKAELDTYIPSLVTKSFEQLQTEVNALAINRQQISRSIAEHEAAIRQIRDQLTKINAALAAYSQSYGITNFFYDTFMPGVNTREDYLNARQRCEEHIKEHIKEQLRLKTRIPHPFSENSDLTA